MKNLDTSLLGSTNLDESISNTDGQGTSTTPTVNTGAGSTNWADAIAASIGLTNTIVQTRTTPKNEEEQACGVKPLFAGAKMDAWNKCVSNYNASKQAAASTPSYTPPTVEEKSTNWWLVGGGIVAGLALLGTAAYFIFRPKK